MNQSFSAAVKTLNLVDGRWLILGDVGDDGDDTYVYMRTYTVFI